MTRRATGLLAATTVMWALAITLPAGRTTAPDPAGTAQAPARLVDTGLYAGGTPGEVDARNRAFTPQYPLWSDGLVKRRWVHLPPGGVIDASNEDEWVVPVGTKFWKEFAAGERRVETRFSWRASETEWVFATYVWNKDGTDAVRADDGGVPGVVPLDGGRRHDIPSRTDCAACHGTSTPTPLGFTALQLSPDRDPLAVHAEPVAPGMITLTDLVAAGRVTGARADLVARPPRVRTDDPATRAMLGYLVGNCSACHNGRGEIAALGPVIRVRDLVEDGDAVARRLIGQPTRWQRHGAPDGETVLVDPGSPETSAIFLRMKSRRPSSQMPPLGTVVRDDAAVALVRAWIEGRGSR